MQRPGAPRVLPSVQEWRGGAERSYREPSQVPCGWNKQLQQCGRGVGVLSPRQEAQPAGAGRRSLGPERRARLAAGTRPTLPRSGPHAALRPRPHRLRRPFFQGASLGEPQATRTPGEPHLCCQRTSYKEDTPALRPGIFGKNP